MLKLILNYKNVRNLWKIITTTEYQLNKKISKKVLFPANQSRVRKCANTQRSTGISNGSVESIELRMREPREVSI